MTAPVVTVGGNVHFFPIRHHSPACAHHLARALADLKPVHVLVEAPEDFQALLPQLTDPRVVAPVAVLSLAAGADDDRGAPLYPFCAHSPELVALRWAREAGAEARLIDLPARDPRMGMRHRSDPAGGQRPLIDDDRLDHNAYVAELCRRRGIPDGEALWDALFETQAAGDDWRGFFETVGVYCQHIRAVTPEAEMAGDGTLDREGRMASHLAEAVAAGGPVAVITGGFHTPPLQAGLGKAPPRQKAAKAPAGRAWLIRYGFRQIDRLSGYGAGLPHPAWYDRLWTALSTGEPLEAMSLQVLAGFSDYLRRTAPGLSVPTPTLTAATIAARRLADLRGLPFPGRRELIDAVRSTAVKDALELGRAPILDAFDLYLTGDRLGQLPPGAAQPPIVEAIRAQARSLGFALDDAARRDRDLDLLRKPRHAEASRFLHALLLIDAGFASRTAGADAMHGYREDALFETWSYSWSPMVEQRLIDLAPGGESLEQVCAWELRRRRAAMAEEGRSRRAAEVASLLHLAARTGMEPLIAMTLEWCAEAIAEDPDLASLVQTLALVARIPAGEDIAEAIYALQRQGFERLLVLFPHLAATPPDQLSGLIAALAELAALVGEAENGEAGQGEADRQALGEVVGQALAAGPGPALEGALCAFAGLIGAMGEETVAARVAAVMDGAFVDPGQRAAALNGCLTVSPRLIVRSEALLAAADRFIGGVEPETFLAVLPELRLALSQLSPDEIDRVAQWASRRHGLSAHPTIAANLPAGEVEANLLLARDLAAVWRADGLSAWMEGA